MTLERWTDSKDSAKNSTATRAIVEAIAGGGSHLQTKEVAAAPHHRVGSGTAFGRRFLPAQHRRVALRRWGLLVLTVFAILDFHPGIDEVDDGTECVYEHVALCFGPSLAVFWQAGQ